MSVSTASPLQQLDIYPAAEKLGIYTVANLKQVLLKRNISNACVKYAQRAAVFSEPFETLPRSEIQVKEIVWHWLDRLYSPLTFSDEERKARGDRLRNYKATVKSVGYSLKPNGYYEVTMGENKFRPLHVVIMEEHIGRRLRKDECVHHINQVRTDNRIENLQLMTRSEHSKLHAHKRHNSK